MKPILFNTDMVRAIQAGRKTVTRRAIKPQPPGNAIVHKQGCYWNWTRWVDTDAGHLMLPPCKPGDILWVRETWGTGFDAEGGTTGKYVYKADAETVFPTLSGCWHPSIHMPKEAARLFLRVTDVRVERLQDITDYRSEGIKPSEACEGCFAVCGGCAPLNSPTGCDNEIEAFAELWDGTIKSADLPRYGWEANPWVWVIRFERVSQEAAQREEGQDTKSAPSAAQDTTTL